MDEVKKLQEISREVRKLVVEIANRSKSAHVGPALSCVDLLVYLYFHELNLDEKRFEDRDIFVLSKGHAAMALYAVLAFKGLIDKETLYGYFQNNGTLPGHLDKFTNKWIEVSAGSLGHGFNIALGMAYGNKFKRRKVNVYALIGDGESQEGSIWEGALFAPKLKIDNFTAILDRNDMQGYGKPSEICFYEPIEEKWKAFGWTTSRVNGHDFSGIQEGFHVHHDGKPKIVIADTVKGKGVSFMENDQKWHYFIVTDSHKTQAFCDLSGVINEK